MQSLRWVLSSFWRQKRAQRRISPICLVPISSMAESGAEIPDPNTPVTLIEREWLSQLLQECLEAVGHQKLAGNQKRFEESLWKEDSEAFAKNKLTGAERTSFSRARGHLRALIRSRLKLEDEVAG